MLDGAFQLDWACGEVTERRAANASASRAPLDPGRLPFIDETNVYANAVPLYRRGPRGLRLVDDGAPLGTWQIVTFFLVLRHDRMVAPILIDWPMEGDLFLLQIEWCLMPGPGATRYRDNGSFARA